MHMAQSHGTAADADANGEHGGTSAPRRLIEAADAVLVDIEYVRPIKERHDAVRQLGFTWETARLKDGSGLAVVCDAGEAGLCTQRYASASAVDLHQGAAAPTVERGDILIRLNKVVLSEEEGELLPALLSKAGELNRLSVRVLRAKPAALERVIEHGLAAVITERIDGTLVAEVAAAAVPPPAPSTSSASGAHDSPSTEAQPMAFMAALADAVGLGPSEDDAAAPHRRRYERAKAHALLSRELALKLNELRKGENAADGPHTDHPATPVWLALAAFGIGAPEAPELCRAALATEIGAARQFDVLAAFSRSLATVGDLAGAKEQLWLEAAAAEMTSPRDCAAIIRCLFDVAVVADHEAAATAGIAAAWEPLDVGVVELYVARVLLVFLFLGVVGPSGGPSLLGNCTAFIDVPTL